MEKRKEIFFVEYVENKSDKTLVVMPNVCRGVCTFRIFTPIYSSLIQLNDRLLLLWLKVVVVMICALPYLYLSFI